MQTPVEITFRSMDPSPAVEQSIRSHAARLHHFYDRIERCAVTVEIPHRSQRQGKRFAIHIQLTVPERTIAISRDPGLDHGHEDIHVAVADAFRAARRQLQDHVHILRGNVKIHA